MSENPLKLDQNPTTFNQNRTNLIKMDQNPSFLTTPLNQSSNLLSDFESDGFRRLKALESDFESSTIQFGMANLLSLFCSLPCSFKSWIRMEAEPRRVLVAVNLSLRS